MCKTALFITITNMKSPEDRSWNRKLNMATAGLVLGYAGMVWGTENLKTKVAASETQGSCAALVSTIEGINPDETQRQQLCTNDLISGCLADTDICKK